MRWTWSTRRGRGVCSGKIKQEIKRFSGIIRVVRDGREGKNMLVEDNVAG
jgi:hypothetical protein